MEYRSVGANALAALDSDSYSRPAPATCWLSTGAAQHIPAQAARTNALLAYLPPIPAGAARGALFMLTVADAAPLGGRPAAVLAAEQLARAYYASLARGGGQALLSAVDGAIRHLAALAHAVDAPGVDFACVALQGRQAWVTRRGAVMMGVLRPAQGQWVPLHALPSAGHRDRRTATFFQPVALEPGDLLLVLSRAVQERLSKHLIRRCLLALSGAHPPIGMQQIAETLVNLVAVEEAAAPVAALLVRCDAVLPTALAQERGWPAAGCPARRLPADAPWDLDSLPALSVAPPTPSAASEHTAPRLLPVDTTWLPAAPAPVAAPRSTPPAARAQRPTPGAGAASGWESRLNLPSLLVALCGLALLNLQEVSPLSIYYLLGLLSLVATAGLLVVWMQAPHPIVAHRGQLLFAGPAPHDSAAQASQRLKTDHRYTARERSDPPGGAGGRAPAPLTASKARLVLPHDRALQEGCLDIVSLRDAGGRITAQVVLICPAHLLAPRSGQPVGLYVVLHDLLEDRRTGLAWLAPGAGRAVQAATASDLAELIGLSRSLVQIVGQDSAGTLRSPQVQVTIRVERHRFAERFRKQHLAVFEVGIAVQRAGG